MTTNLLLDKSSSSFNPTTSAKSFIAKLTSPLRQRTRNLSEFYIKPKEPHRRYSSGDLVEGVVVLKVLKPIRVTHITVALHGFVHVYKSVNNTAELTNNESQYLQSGNAKKSQYFGNGHASLFQDEVTLCGEGRIEPGQYEFAFELEFPRRSLPSSIDFERGTISYQIRSTITRPTSIAAVTSCDRKINLVESVDIGLMAVPKPRTISLEPIFKRGRRTKTIKHNPPVPNEVSGSEELGRSDSPTGEENSSDLGSTERQNGPRSPYLNSDGGKSERSDSIVSGSTGTEFRLGPAPQLRSERCSKVSNTSSTEKTIFAKIELLKAGCLPGDTLSFKINIQHVKPIRSMHGIIITLYRQCRIDSAPPLELFKDLTGKAAQKMKHEEYYPKSKTGLGGLSLTSAGSSNTFRKDLSQSFAPIIIDPISLATEVPATIRVPEDVFPTITGTPAQMIIFRYFVEVIVDLGGKLAGQERHVARMGVINVPNNFVDRPGRAEGGGNTLSALSGNIVETEYVRREKSVVTSQFEIVVGTKDSMREGRRRAETFSRTRSVDRMSPRSQNFLDFHGQYGEDLPNDYDPRYSSQPDQNEEYHGNGDYYSNGDHQPGTYSEHDNHLSRHINENDPSYSQPNPYGSQIVSVPPPEAVDESGLTEKERLRQAETRLLPSQPPGEESGPSSRQHLFVPSAPAYADDHDNIPNYMQAMSIASTPGRSSSFYRNNTDTTRVDGPSAPPAINVQSIPPSSIHEHAHNISGPSRTDASDDKQELERRRLMVEASSPDDFMDEDLGQASTTFNTPSAPSAPTFDEVHDHSFAEEVQTTIPGEPGPSHVVARPFSEHLPRYER